MARLLLRYQKTCGFSVYKLQAIIKQKKGMKYFIIIYRVVVDHQTYYGKVGRATKQVNKMLFETKAAIEEGYSNMFPDAGSINVFIVKNRQITLLEYLGFVKVAEGHSN